MNKLILSVALLAISFTAHPLSPDMQADRYLLQIRKAVSNYEFQKAANLMEKIVSLNLQLPTEFYFKYAKIYSKIKTNDYRSIEANKAFTAINHFLKIAGKQSRHYEAALDIYDWAVARALLGEAKNTDEVRQILANGANIGDTLLYVVKHNRPDIIKAFVAAGADVNRNYNDDSYRNRDGSYGGDTLLYYATVHSTLDVIKALVAAGAKDDKDLVNAAKRYGRGKETIEFLSEMSKRFDENTMQQFNQL